MNQLNPKSFFLVKGKGISKISTLNAFDKALLDAGLGQCNLVPVSSILPVGSTKIRPAAPEPGQITFCVMSKAFGSEGQDISCGLGWAMLKDELGQQKYGVVAECSAVGKTIAHVQDRIEVKLKQMAADRRMSFDAWEFIGHEIKDISEDEMGCVLSLLVYILGD